MEAPGSRMAKKERRDPSSLLPGHKLPAHKNNTAVGTSAPRRSPLPRQQPMRHIVRTTGQHRSLAHCCCCCCCLPLRLCPASLLLQTALPRRPAAATAATVATATTAAMQLHPPLITCCRCMECSEAAAEERQPSPSLPVHPIRAHACSSDMLMREHGCNCLPVFLVTSTGTVLYSVDVLAQQGSA